MKIKFDSKQNYQREAIDAVVNLFKGQPNAGMFIDLKAIMDPTLEGATGTANQLILSDEAIIENMNTIQTINGIENIKSNINNLNKYDFSIEMETGTGKTYVYLRTIIELYLNYGFSKFIIVVPSVAIREGVLKSLELMQEHFKQLYDNLQFDSYTYDSKILTRLRQFAQSNELQIMIMNLDAFNKESNIINRPNEDLGGIEPISFIQQTKPILILDEPQNMENEKSKEALNKLNPLFKLRYSATHKYPYNLLYRLDPVKAYQLNLVKRIGVTSVINEENFNQPYILFHETKANSSNISVQLTIDELQKDGTVKRKKKWLKAGDDLFDKSNGREMYKGYIIQQIHHGEKWISFENSFRLEKGFSLGVNRDDMMKLQLEETIRAQFEKELEVLKLPRGQKLKILSLVFIDKVANYANSQGKIRLWYKELYTAIKEEARYDALSLPEAENAQGSYFSEDKKKQVYDTSGQTKQDDEAYNKIMRDKEKLLDLNEPIRFIFSHSALREGWDNPNVFQICTLNETFSEIKKRQEIGRGLRLPVNEAGERCTDMVINRLTVIANEHYNDFANALQTEMLDAGYNFTKNLVNNNRERKSINLLPKWKENRHFIELWDRIKHKTQYSVLFDTQKLISEAALRVQSIRLQAPKIKVLDIHYDLSHKGIIGEVKSEYSRKESSLTLPIPNIVEAIQRSTQLKRRTIIEILQRADNYEQFILNPQRYIEEVTTHIRSVLINLMVNGVKYKKIAGSYYEMRQFELEEMSSYLSRAMNSSKSIFNATEIDSSIERNFAEELERMADILFYLKLPYWFKIKTPLGNYNPDWAIVKNVDGHELVYFVAETKSSSIEEDLRGTEVQKIKCGREHFNTLNNVNYKVIKELSELYV